MVMDYLKKRVQKAADDNQCIAPNWTSKKNSSFDAWEYVEKARKEKERYIRSHKKITDYLTKQKFQIKGSDVAKALNISRVSLMNTSGYSESFRKYLDDVNAELELLKNETLKAAKKSPSRGSIQNSKEELLAVNTELRKKITELESKNTEKLVKYAFDQLPFPVKKKLGINH